MNILGIIILVILLLSAAGCFVIGFFKRFDKVKTWALEFILAALLSMGIGGSIAKGVSANPAAAGIVGIALSVAFVLLMILAFKFAKIPFTRQRKKEEKAKEAAELTDTKPAKSFSLLRLFSRLLGGVAKAMQAVVVVGVIAVCVIALLDLSQFAAVQSAFGSLFTNPLWLSAKSNMMDFLTIGIFYLCIKSGYSSGVSGALWAFLMVVLIGVVALISYNLAFKVEAFGQAAQNLSANVPVLSGQIARFVVMAGIFVVLLVPVIIAGIFVPRLLSGARDSKLFYAIDGGLGAFFALILAIGLLLVIGNVVNSVSEFEFMAPFNAYFEKTAIAKYFYTENVLSAMNVNILSLDKWFAPAQPAEPVPEPVPEPAV